MTCYHPLKAWLPKSGDEHLTSSGTLRPIFESEYGRLGGYNVVVKAYDWKQVQIPCGQCIGCRLDKSAQWACRCLHESSLYPSNSFLTLTFNDENINPDMSLHKEDFTDFMKRLRRFVDYNRLNYGQKIRFFHCGEYGDLNARPHHHAIIFNFDFPDKYVWSESNLGVRYYRSPMLERLWPYGFSMIGNVTFESCGYVARYVTKKITGKMAEEYYAGRIPPYLTMSRRPGIGMDWLKKYVRDVYPNDFVVSPNGHLFRPPRYYDQMYEYLQALAGHDLLEDTPAIDEIKEKRRDRAIEMKAKQYNDDMEEYERLAVKEKIKNYKMIGLKRQL